MSTEAGLGPGPEETLDAIGGDELRLLQHRRGYRFTLDAILLAGFALQSIGARPARHLVDLGTGSGVVGLLVTRRGGARRTTLIEVQPALASLARRNAALNDLEAEVIEADLRQPILSLAHSADLVVSNPPYVPVADGKPCSDEERNIARREERCTLEELVAATKRLLRPEGLATVVYPVARLPALLAALTAHRLSPARLRFVHPKPHEPAYAFLLEARPNSRRPLRVEPPLVVHGEDGAWTREVRWLLSKAESAAG